MLFWMAESRYVATIFIRKVTKTVKGRTYKPQRHRVVTNKIAKPLLRNDSHQENVEVGLGPRMPFSQKCCRQHSNSIRIRSLRQIRNDILRTPARIEFSHGLGGKLRFVQFIGTSKERHFRTFIWSVANSASWNQTGHSKRGITPA
jgi:hypothetical protein